MTEDVSEEKEVSHYPRIKIQEINQEAAPYFEAANADGISANDSKKLRRKGLNLLQARAEAYVIENNLEPERLTELKTSELVFLFSNLAKSKNPEIVKKELFRRLWDECDERLALAEENEWNITEKERAALMKYCRMAPKLIPFSGLSKECWESFIPHYKKSLTELEALKPQKESKRSKEKEENKPQDNKVEVNEVLPQTENETSVRPKQYSNDFIRNFKKSAPAYGIRFKRTDKKEDNFIKYDLYPWKKQENEQPTGKLTIHDDKKITLASQEYEHFVAIAKALKNSGSEEILLQQLSKNPDEAKTFAANMVVAGYIVDIKVSQPFKLEELQKYNPRIGQILQHQKQPVVKKTHTR